MFYLPARYHDPATYRFLSPDPAPPSAGDPLSLNAFVYCLGDPVGLDDPSGADPPGKGIHKPGTKEAAEWNRYLRGVRAISWHGGRAVRNVSGCHGVRQLPMVYDEMSPWLAAAIVVGVIGGAYGLTLLAAGGGTAALLGVGTSPAAIKAAEVIGDPSDEYSGGESLGGSVSDVALIGKTADVQAASALNTQYDTFTAWAPHPGLWAENLERNRLWVQYHISRGDPFFYASDIYSPANIYYGTTAEYAPFGYELDWILSAGYVDMGGYLALP